MNIMIFFFNTYFFHQKTVGVYLVNMLWLLLSLIVSKPNQENLVKIHIIFIILVHF